MLDVAVHLSSHADSATVEVSERDGSHWVDLTDAHGVELTFFVDSAQQALALALAFVACGVERIMPEVSGAAAIQSESCDTAQ